MQSGNNIHVKQDKTNMINGEWNKTQNNAPFVAFYDMRAVTFVLPDEMADVSIAGLQWLITFNKNDRKFSKRVENTVRKGEIARYEQFLLFPRCFQKTCTTYT